MMKSTPRSRGPLVVAAAEPVVCRGQIHVVGKLVVRNLALGAAHKAPSAAAR